MKSFEIERNQPLPRAEVTFQLPKRRWRTTLLSWTLVITSGPTGSSIFAQMPNGSYQILVKAGSDRILSIDTKDKLLGLSRSGENGNSAFVIKNTYICDASGRELSQAKQNQVVSDALNAIPSANNAVHKNILFSQLDGRKLPDGDQIRISESAGPDSNSGRVTIKLVLPRGMWWKGVLLFDKVNNKPSKEVGLQGEGGGSGFSNSYTFLRTNLLKKDLVLSKAKSFGVHTNMYRIADAFTKMKAGHTYTISWSKD